MTQHLHEMQSGPDVVLPPTSATSCAARERAEARREAGEPGLIDLRQGQRQQRPGGSRAHGRQIAQIHGQRAMADRLRRRARREMPAFARACRSWRRAASPGGHSSSAASSPTPSVTSARCAPQSRKIALDELELAERHGASVLVGRSSRAARSSTALTNLWPSVAPKRRARLTPSLITTRYGHLGARLQLVRADQQQRVLDGIERARACGPSRSVSVGIERVARIADAAGPARGNIRRRRGPCPLRSRTPDEVLPGPSFICQRYSACIASLRASERAPEVYIRLVHLSLAMQVRHLERDLHRFAALVAAGQRRRARCACSRYSR